MNQVDFFKCLADQTRLDILMMIVKQGERCVCDLTVGLDLSQPKISRHLALLRSAQILQDRRQGQWVYYRLHDDLALWCKEIYCNFQHRISVLSALKMHALKIQIVVNK